MVQEQREEAELVLANGRMGGALAGGAEHADPLAIDRDWPEDGGVVVMTVLLERLPVQARVPAVDDFHLAGANDVGPDVRTIQAAANGGNDRLVLVDAQDAANQVVLGVHQGDGAHVEAERLGDRPQYDLQHIAQFQRAGERTTDIA